MLKAKAWLWSLISTGVVVLVLAYSIYLYPADAWKVALVGVGWLVFARSMAEKTVTLVTVTSESGDAEPIPRSRRWAASLGMMTFAIGVLTQQWNLAVVGVVYSHLTAAAMWESFRARLPFLYDPWSERLPPPPTLISPSQNHAMDRRTFLGVGSAALATIALALSQAKGQDLEKVAAAEQGKSASDAGPENVALRDANPNTFLPPPTDHGEVQTFWSTFSTAHRRVQEGGWSRQVTVTDFPISKEIAGVNMRLTAGGVREPQSGVLPVRAPTRQRLQ